MRRYCQSSLIVWSLSRCCWTLVCQPVSNTRSLKLSHTADLTEADVSSHRLLGALPTLTGRSHSQHLIHDLSKAWELDVFFKWLQWRQYRDISGWIRVPLHPEHVCLSDLCWTSLTPEEGASESQWERTCRTHLYETKPKRDLKPA